MAVVVALAPVALAACGENGSKSDKAADEAMPTPLAITTSDAGSKRFRTAAPKRVKGGLVNLTFVNASKKDEHEAALLRVDGAHTAKEVLEFVASDSEAIPNWMHIIGGAGSTRPGQTVRVTLNLPAGRYVMVDGGNGDPPVPALRGALAEFEVTAGTDGALPAANATITATNDERAEPKNGFRISGLKAGRNRLHFVTKGEEAHHAVLFAILPGRTFADVKTFLTSEGRPSGPPPVDFASAVNTAALDGDRGEVTDLVLRKPGRYAVVCFLKDRDGKGKRHLAEGMLKVIDVT